MDLKAQSKKSDSKENIAEIKETAVKAEKAVEKKAADKMKAIETKADSVKKIAQAKTEAVKEEVAKAAEAVKEEVAKAVEEKAAKAPAKKAAAKKPAAAKAPAKKAPAKTKKPVQTTLVVEYQGRQIEEKDIVAAVKKVWTQSGNKVGEIKTMELYVKPEDSAVYFVINGSETGKADI